MSGIACGATTMRVDPGMTCNGGSQQASNGGGVGLMSVGGGGSHNGPGNLVQDNNNQVLPQPSLECHTNGTNGEAVQPWKLLSHDTAKMNKLGEIVDSTASHASKCMVDNLLQQVSQLSDVEKFLLYLKLPVGRPPDIDPLKQPLNPLGSRSEIQLTITWIQTHLEMNSEVSLPKREVYNEYMHYCTLNNVKPLSTADFGKVMKQVFPGVRPRRLGQRGASKYCYSGLRKKYTLEPPTLPDLNDNCTKKNVVGVDCPVDDEEIDRAAGNLVLEWAEKLCSVKYDTMRDLALHLVQKNYVDNRSVAAFTLLSVADQKHGILSGGAGGGKHRETQIQLQRKLQEREHIKEQKRKMQEQPPLVNKPAAERPKSRRRSGTNSRNPSGEANVFNNNNGNLNNNKIIQNSGLMNGNCDIIGEGLSNGDKHNMEGGNSNNSSNSAGIQGGVITIKQEDEHQTSFDSFDSLLDDKLHPNDTTTYGIISNNIINIGHSSANMRRNSDINHFVPDNNNMPIASKGINKNSPTKKTFVTMPSGVPMTSPKSRYKPIQPKLTDSKSGVAVTPIGNSSTQWTEVINTGADDLNFPRTETIPTSIFSGDGNIQRVLQTQTSVEQQFSDSCNFNINNNNNPNDEVGEDELRQSIMCDVQKTSQLSELKKLLIEKKLVPTMGDGGACGDSLDHDVLGSSGIPKRVSFQSNQLPNMQNFGPVPPSPNTRRKEFNFQPIGSNPDQIQSMSQCSSVDASPFMSPRNTPLQRSRHNSGQTSSTYITPRSTPFTPDQPQIPINQSESSTPFMSPITTPQYPRSRHNSSQNLRTPYTPTVRSRHSSGPFRHVPYTNEDARRGKFRSSRHPSGSIPPSPSSAPMSPLVQDATLHPPHDPLGLASGSMLQRMLNNKQNQGYTNTDLRRRHLSAGSTIHYHQPQPPTFPQDALGQEVNNVMTFQAGPSNGNQSNPSRPQSVPLLQMLNMPTSSHDNFAKSHPNTPMTNQQFIFNSDCCGSSQPSSYAPTPVPSEFNDFTEEYNLEGIDPMLDVNLPNDPGGTVNGLESIDNAIHLANNNASTDLSTLSELSQQVPPNINPFSGQFNSVNTNPAGPKSCDSILVSSGDIMSSNLCCDSRQLNNGPGTQNVYTANSMLTLNELNSSVRRGLNLDSGSGGLEDFQPTLADLGDQEMFNSLVLDVNKD